MLKTKELNEKTAKQLEELLKQLKEELFVLRFQQATGQLAEGHRLPSVKKDISRVLTEINSREIIVKGASNKKQFEAISKLDSKERKLEALEALRGSKTKEDINYLKMKLGLVVAKPSKTTAPAEQAVAPATTDVATDITEAPKPEASETKEG